MLVISQLWLVTTWLLAMTALKICVEIRHRGLSLKLRAVPAYAVAFIGALGVSRRMNVPAEAPEQPGLVESVPDNGRELE